MTIPTSHREVFERQPYQDRPDLNRPCKIIRGGDGVVRVFTMTGRFVCLIDEASASADEDTDVLPSTDPREGMGLAGMVVFAVIFFVAVACTAALLLKIIGTGTNGV